MSASYVTNFDFTSTGKGPGCVEQLLGMSFESDFLMQILKNVAFFPIDCHFGWLPFWWASLVVNWLAGKDAENKNQGGRNPLEANV